MPHLSKGGHELGADRGARCQVCTRHLANNKHLLGNYGVPLWREQATCSSGLQKRDTAVLTGGAGARGPYPPRHHCARLVQLLQPSMLGLLLKGETEAGRGTRPAARAQRPCPPHHLSSRGSSLLPRPSAPPPAPRHWTVCRPRRGGLAFSNCPSVVLPGSRVGLGIGAPCAAPIGCRLRVACRQRPISDRGRSRSP